MNEVAIRSGYRRRLYESENWLCTCCTGKRDEREGRRQQQVTQRPAQSVKKQHLCYAKHIYVYIYSVAEISSEVFMLSS